MKPVFWYLCLWWSVSLSSGAGAEELLPAQAATTAPAPCHLVAHLNESKELTTAAGLQLPRWYDLHHRLLKLLTDKAGCSLEVVGSPWPRSLALLREGKIDLMLTMSYTLEREQYADFIGPHYLEETVLVLDKQYLPKVKKLSDILLLPGAVGVLRDAWYGDEFAQVSLETEFQPYLQYANSLTQKLNLLQKERVVGMLEDKTQYLEWSRTYPDLATRYKIAFRLNSNPVYIVASRKGVPFAVRERLRHAWYQVYGGPEHRAILNECGWGLE